MIRITPTLLDGSFDTRNLIPVKSSHFDFFNEGSIPFIKQHKFEKTELHWRLDQMSYDEAGRFKNSLGQAVLCLDLDLRPEFTERLDFSNNPQAIQKYKELVETTLIINPDTIGIASTGYGLHIYIFFDKVFNIPDETWLKPLAVEIGKKNFGKLEFDLGSFKELRTMRIPNSFYAKPKKQRIEGWNLVLVKPTAKQSFDEFREKFKHLKPVEKKKEIKGSDNLLRFYDKNEVDTNAIYGSSQSPYSGCRFLRFAFDNQSQVNYNEWFASLTLISKFKKDPIENLAFAKSCSEKHPTFNDGELKERFDQARNTFPYTCEKISQIWRRAEDTNIGCVTCPHRKRNMPLYIQDFPDQQSGFRTIRRDQNGKVVSQKLNQFAFLDYLNKEEKIIPEADGSIYRHNGKYYERYKESLLFTDYGDKIIPRANAPEINSFFTIFRNNSVMDIGRLLEDQKNLIFFNNLILDYKTGKLTQYDESLKNLYRLNFDYDPAARCPNFKEFVDWALGDNMDQLSYFFRYIAAALFTRDHLEKALLLVGSGANGKSTLVNAIQNIYPRESHQITGISLDNLARDLSFFSTIRQCKIAYSSDNHPDMINRHPDLIKKIVSGEEITYRMPYARGSISFNPIAKLVLGMNTIPNFKENTKGLRRRISIIEFNNQIEDSKVDITLGEKLKAERAGIFNYLLNHLNEYFEKGLPRLNEEESDEYFQSDDLKEHWWNDEIIFEKDGKVTNEDLFRSFVNYFEKASAIKYNAKTNRSRLSVWVCKRPEFKRQFDRWRLNTGRGFKGIKLRTEPTIELGYDPK